MKQLASAIGAAFLVTGFALLASPIAIAQVPPKPDYAQPWNFEWEAITGHVAIQYDWDHEGLIVKLSFYAGDYIVTEPLLTLKNPEYTERLRSRISAGQLKVWVLTDEGGALVRSKGQSVEPIGEIGNAGSITWDVPFTFKWTPATRISAIVLKAGERNYLFPVKAN